MKQHIKYWLLVCHLALSGVITGQTDSESKTGYIWNPTSGMYVKQGQVTTTSGPARTLRSYRIASVSDATVVSRAPSTRKIVTSHRHVWVLTNRGARGHWVRPRRNEIKDRRKAEAPFVVPVSIDSFQAYPKYKRGIRTYRAPEKTVSVRAMTPNKKFLGKENLETENLVGQGNRMALHFARNIDLGSISFDEKKDHVLVVDTLYVPPAAPSKSSFKFKEKAKRQYIKIVANCIVYESPISLFASNREITDVVFSAKKIFLKSPYEELEKYELVPAPPLFISPNNNNIYIYRNVFDDLEEQLLNQLYISIMQQIFSELNATPASAWEKDKLLTDFQTYRQQKVDTDILSNDIQYERDFNRLCAEFDAVYEDYQVDKYREMNDLKIWIHGKLDNLAQKPFTYYTLPTKGQLLPVANNKIDSLEQSALGSVYYASTGDEGMKLSIDVSLEYDKEKLDAANAQLKDYGVVIQERVPKSILSIEEQPLKINGRHMGRIVPLSGKMLRLEIDIDEGAKTFADLFPKAGGISFKVDFTMNGMVELQTEELLLQVDSSLLAQIDYNKPLESFNVIENTELTETVKVVSSLDAAREQEEALHHVDVILEFQFDDRKVNRGPYRLSSYNTLASELTIPFLKFSNDYTITISGTAFYANGYRTITPFSVDRGKIIVLEETMFAQYTEDQ